MKKLSKILLVLILMAMVLVTGCNQTELNCIKSGGKWTSFSNSCADSCDYKRGAINVCSTVITEGCDCGIEMCWNGTGCEKL